MKISRGGEGKKATTTGMVNHVKNKHNHEFLQLQEDSSVTASTSQGTTSNSLGVSNLKVTYFIFNFIKHSFVMS